MGRTCSRYSVWVQKKRDSWPCSIIVDMTSKVRLSKPASRRRGKGQHDVVGAGERAGDALCMRMSAPVATLT